MEHIEDEFSILLYNIDTRQFSLAQFVPLIAKVCSAIVTNIHLKRCKRNCPITSDLDKIVMSIYCLFNIEYSISLCLTTHLGKTNTRCHIFLYIPIRIFHAVGQVSDSMTTLT